MSKAQQLMREATESDDFDARHYFMGGLEPLGERGFEHREYDAVDDLDTWHLDVPPFWVWGTMTPKGIQIAVEIVMQGDRTSLNRWTYRPEDVDAAIAQVDRIMPLVKNFNSVPGREQACGKLRAMGPAPGVNEAEDVDDFDASAYMDYPAQLEKMGFKFTDAVGAYTKSYPLAPGVSLVVALFYNTPKAFVDVYVAAADQSEQFGVIKHLKSVPADDVYTYVDRASRVAAKLKDAGVTSAKQVIAQCNRERLLENEQEFDPREYFLSNPTADMLKQLGYEKMGDSDSYTKQVLSDTATAHYLTVYGTEFPGDPTTVIIEYQKHIPMIGFVFPWSVRVEHRKLTALLPLLESAIKSAWDQELTEVETKAVLDALVK